MVEHRLPEVVFVFRLVDVRLLGVCYDLGLRRQAVAAHFAAALITGALPGDPDSSVFTLAQNRTDHLNEFGGEVVVLFAVNVDFEYGELRDPALHDHVSVAADQTPHAIPERVRSFEHGLVLLDIEIELGIKLDGSSDHAVVIHGVLGLVHALLVLVEADDSVDLLVVLIRRRQRLGARAFRTRRMDLLDRFGHLGLRGDAPRPEGREQDDEPEDDRGHETAVPLVLARHDFMSLSKG